MEWAFVGSCRDGEPFCLNGVDVWQGPWQKQPGIAVVTDPQYGREFHFSVWTRTTGERTIRFAAGEFSHGVWGFYVEVRKQAD
jgi:hypothetical protein